ncbi:GntR family transcriptional regulator [Amnibacterium sp. CER49]|uniref:GntR family transcriptional regulator n=1 Tax=Amnibacterium sp. CER49 TaxID=3039161 RepID=UPI002448FC8D|nr:GntR family transcriptional regulator [Amnibacterium sp. CER49]MDH2443213.1 GntR family transcriptional regulator [Amnibacterium sp. CER49]
MTDELQIGIPSGAEGVAAGAYKVLLSAVQRGVYPAGSRLPSERQLSERLGISRATLRVALLQLAAEGHLQSSAQRGWFVSVGQFGEAPSTLQSFSEIAEARGLRATSKILSRRERAADFQESERLHVAPGSRVLELVRLRGMDETPLCVDTAVLPMPKAAPLLDLDLTDRSLYEVLRSTCGIEVRRSSYTIRAKAAERRVAELLEVPVGSPLLVGRETTYTGDGRPVNLGYAQYRGDAYEFQADLFRPEA